MAKAEEHDDRIYNLDELIDDIFTAVYAKTVKYRVMLIDPTDMKLSRFKVASGYDLDTVFRDITLAGKHPTGLSYTELDWNGADISEILIKRVGFKFPCMLRIVPYQTSASINDIRDPINVNQVLKTLLSELVVRDKTYNLLLPVVNIDAFGSDLMAYPQLTRSIDKNRFYSIQITEKYWSITTLKDFFSRNPVDRDILKSVLHQIIDVLYKINSAFPDFRHNYLFQEVIDCYIFPYKGKKFPIIKLDNFYLSEISMLVPNNYPKNPEIPNINHSYSDIFLFANNLWNTHQADIQKYPEIVEIFDFILPTKLRTDIRDLLPAAWDSLSQVQKDELTIKEIWSNKLFADRDEFLNFSFETIQDQDDDTTEGDTVQLEHITSYGDDDLPESEQNPDPDVPIFTPTIVQLGSDSEDEEEEMDDEEPEVDVLDQEGDVEENDEEVEDYAENAELTAEDELATNTDNIYTDIDAIPIIKKSKDPKDKKYSDIDIGMSSKPNHSSSTKSQSQSQSQRKSSRDFQRDAKPKKNEFAGREFKGTRKIKISDDMARVASQKQKKVVNDVSSSTDPISRQVADPNTPGAMASLFGVSGDDISKQRLYEPGQGQGVPRSNQLPSDQTALTGYPGKMADLLQQQHPNIQQQFGQQLDAIAPDQQKLQEQAQIARAMALGQTGPTPGGYPNEMSQGIPRIPSGPAGIANPQDPLTSDMLKQYMTANQQLNPGSGQISQDTLDALLQQQQQQRQIPQSMDYNRASMFDYGQQAQSSAMGLGNYQNPNMTSQLSEMQKFQELQELQRLGKLREQQQLLREFQQFQQMGGGKGFFLRD